MESIAREAQMSTEDTLLGVVFAAQFVACAVIARSVDSADARAVSCQCGIDLTERNKGGEVCTREKLKGGCRAL